MDLIITLSSWWSDIFGGVLSDIASVFNSSVGELLNTLLGTVDDNSPLVIQFIYNTIKNIMSIVKIGGTPIFDIDLFSLMFSGGVIALIIFAIFKYLLDFAD